jgi:hypothetical protein
VSIGAFNSRSEPAETETRAEQRFIRNGYGALRLRGSRPPAAISRPLLHKRLTHVDASEDAS